MRAALALVALLAATPAAIAEPNSQAAMLAGEWTVDLRLKPSDPVYERPMRLTLADNGTVSGLFYQSPIDTGRWKTDRGRTCVSFRTHDQRGPYHTAACLEGDHVQGQTWAEARNFLFNWNAVRSK